MGEDFRISPNLERQQNVRNFQNNSEFVRKNLNKFEKFIEIILKFGRVRGEEKFQIIVEFVRKFRIVSLQSDAFTTSWNELKRFKDSNICGGRLSPQVHANENLKRLSEVDCALRRISKQTRR